MQFDITFRGASPISHQITDHVRTQVALGKAKPGARLPAIRGLAVRLGVDPGTVARAYRTLEQDGAIVTRGANGSFIAAPGERASEPRRDRLAALADGTIMESLGLGFTVADIETAFTLRLAGWRERRAGKPRHERTSAGKRTRIRFAGSHDLAIELLVSHVRSLSPATDFAAAWVGSLSGLIAVESGHADIAGAHLLDQDTGEFNVPFVKRLMPNETVVLINLMQRVQGIMVARHNPKHIIGLEALKRPDVTFVNRQKGSGTRIMLDTRLRGLGIRPEEVRGYDRGESTHLAVATAVAQGQADAGLGAQSAAVAAGLDFIPLARERYDLIALQSVFERPALQTVQDVLRSPEYRTMLNSLAGYDTSDTGNVTIVKPQ